MQQSISFEKLTWTVVEDPDAESLLALKEKHGFHELDIEDCLSENQRSKVDEYEDYLFIILHIPYFDKRKQRIVSEEVDIFIKANLLITVHWGGLKPLNDFYALTEKSLTERKKVMGHSSGYLMYEIVDHLFAGLFPLLDNIESNVNSLEQEAFLGGQKDMLKEILNTKKNIIGFRRVMAPLRTVVAQIEHKNKKFLPDSLEVYFDDVLDKVEKIWSNLENLKELVESLQDTNESLISHTTNNVIKTLTVFSVVMLPLNLLAGMYGMNVHLPYAQHPLIFFVLAGGMLFILFVMLVFFRFKRWI
ncbi:MAG: magnesium transporter CorA family protein [Candidatus Gracilibacteria bacterium]